MGLEVGQRAGPEGSWDQGQFRPKAGTLRRVRNLLITCLCVDPEPGQDLGKQRLSSYCGLCLGAVLFDAGIS